MNTPLKIKKYPINSAVLLYEMKDFLREDRNVEDDLIKSFIETAEQKIIQHTGYHLINTEFEMYLENFNDFKIPVKPFNEDEPFTIEYINQSDEWVELPESNYDLLHQESPIGIELKGELPDTADQKYPIRITFTAGYGDTPASVPKHFQSAIKVLAMMYHKRELPANENENIDLMDINLIKSILNDHRIGRFK